MFIFASINFCEFPDIEYIFAIHNKKFANISGGGRVLSEIPYVAVGWWVGWCLTLKMVKIQKVPRVLFEETRNVFLIFPIYPISILII